MTKKDYELIASVLKDYHKSEQMGWGFDIDNAFADILASKNPRFQKDKFLKACGVEVEKPCNCETCTSKKNRLGICNGLCGCECHCI